ncbi:MAG: LL-diaminopimelate aminotransferase [Fidelibacterota bacterium]|nr:MAG: LL-diaminopimelate aminotransferase [Candidatus Neomarinimicrobiota bacterium]
MATINEHFLKLPANYLFSEIRKRVRDFRTNHPEAHIISLGIGDVTQPLAPAVVAAMKRAVEEMSKQETFHGYGPWEGYNFLREAIIKRDFNPRGVELDLDEVFISDGSKCDLANLQEVFGPDNVVAVADPVFPVYVDTNVMAGRTGERRENGQYEGIIYMPCTPGNDFTPELPGTHADLVYLCYPNNPTGAVATKEALETWINHAREHRSIILFDAAYAAYIADPAIPQSIYEIEGAKEVAVEFRSFSKSAGFTGIRCAYTVVPKDLQAYHGDGSPVAVNPLWFRRQSTKFNSVSYITQRGAAAALGNEGWKQCQQTIATYMRSADRLCKAFTNLGYTVYGGTDAPYIWMETPDGQSSWDFFHWLLDKAHVVCTPGSGFGAAGEGFVRLSAFATPANVDGVLERIEELAR